MTEKEKESSPDVKDHPDKTRMQEAEVEGNELTVKADGQEISNKISEDEPEKPEKEKKSTGQQQEAEIQVAEEKKTTVKEGNKKESKKVTAPVTIAGIMTETFRRERLRPTAKASILVAIDNINNTLMLRELTSLSDSFLMDS